MWQAFRATAFPRATVTLAAISWLAISNHCALGLAAIANPGAGAVTKHDCCAGGMPARPKPVKDPAAPCCKTLQATWASPAKSFHTHADSLLSTPLNRITQIPVEPAHAIVAFQFLDTGPPGRTFAESVLQQSLLAHAPPFFA